ncbi:predicted protein [Sclerotinia sclerotiorum 1980 UF-70]|uniref:Uncharacterized protein n=1 Tax=Sclerotinia sclerotiorum (strain ATCC 18683 / 1980 / Ss-1) TaxID=665079 RepID=A7ECN9_SCLS1|nr:predicted protein [Sclerotinia sclerotiorum 1980 UF-70]EDO00218.1 predicted protein [Sclerotinia sclerotiorum 1980 UF-70]
MKFSVAVWYPKFSSEKDIAHGCHLSRKIDLWGQLGPDLQNALYVA